MKLNMLCCADYNAIVAEEKKGLKIILNKKEGILKAIQNEDK